MIDFVYGDRELYDNKINGSIPKEFGNLAELVSLDLYDNGLTGTIPQELSQLKNLKFLYVSSF
ncbi:brassinosteroid insensitive 1-associated receptor kinase 1 [Phtheirospermum japonicum]|uniref:Brassinosteroid insensitive 1-associated receptor kinase 1 n=2 Tax=Phtheirospermum japonicum TaxID=374723 RepID=A0A830C8M2_9LAMI|nr:brassinosteroid insensitive 1-associated receptor kinase 1 [Phtheirospermum japonicum]